MSDLPITDNFIRRNWSDVRRRVDGLKADESFVVLCDDPNRTKTKAYYSARSAVEHSNHAYDGTRRYSMRKNKGGVGYVVKREE